MENTRLFVVGVIAMIFVVAGSNILVQYPINDWWTWGAFTYPIAFLVNDLTNRALGPRRARQVVYMGFALAVLLSVWLATPRIALASGMAFLIAQLLDIWIFHQLRRTIRWWKAPLISSTIASTIDTGLFFSIAFAGTGLPWLTWGVGDFIAKMCVALAMLVPFRMLKNITRPQGA